MPEWDSRNPLLLPLIITKLVKMDGYALPLAIMQAKTSPLSLALFYMLMLQLTKLFSDFNFEMPKYILFRWWALNPDSPEIHRIDFL